MKWYLHVNWIYLKPKKWVMLNQIEEFFSEAKFVLNWMYTSSIHLVFRSLYQLCVTFRWKSLSWSAARVNIVGTAWLIVIGIKDCLLVTYSDITFFLDANLELNMLQNVSLLFLMKGWKYYPFLKIYVNMSVLILPLTYHLFVGFMMNEFFIKPMATTGRSMPIISTT